MTYSSPINGYIKVCQNFAISLIGGLEYWSDGVMVEKNVID
jgi:hypothetical protein